MTYKQRLNEYEYIIVFSGDNFYFCCAVNIRVVFQQLPVYLFKPQYKLYPANFQTHVKI
jgi:hypothetical protein